MPYLEGMAMQACGNCGTENPAGRTLLHVVRERARSAPARTAARPPRRRRSFCMACGFSLAADGARTAPQPPPAPAPTPRRPRSPRSAAR